MLPFTTAWRWRKSFFQAVCANNGWDTELCVSPVFFVLCCLFCTGGRTDVRNIDGKTPLDRARSAAMKALLRNPPGALVLGCSTTPTVVAVFGYRFPICWGLFLCLGGGGDARIVVVDALVTSVMCAMFHDFCFRGGRCPRTRRRWPCRWENDCGGWCTARCGRAMRAGCGSGRGGGRAQTRLGQCISPGRCVHGRVAASCESYAVFSSVRAGLYSAACNVGGWANVPS